MCQLALNSREKSSVSACIWLKQEISVAPTHRRHRWHLTALRYTWNVRMGVSVRCILEIPNVGSYLFRFAVASPYFICATLVPPGAVFYFIYFFYFRITVGHSDTPGCYWLIYVNRVIRTMLAANVRALTPLCEGDNMSYLNKTVSVLCFQKHANSVVVKRK